MNYSLTFMNNSDRQNTLCLYLRPAGKNDAGPPFSLAWQTKLVPLGGQAELFWRADYAFAWAESGKLAPGVAFEPAQVFPADPRDQRKSAIALNYRWGAYSLEPMQRCTEAGSLCILSEAAVPGDLAAVGICLAGKPAMAWNTVPNHRFIFRPNYQYWAAFGNYEDGVVLDLDAMPDAHEVRFPADGGTVSLSLEQDGSWTEC